MRVHADGFHPAMLSGAIAVPGLILYGMGLFAVRDRWVLFALGTPLLLGAAPIVRIAWRCYRNVLIDLDDRRRVARVNRFVALWWPSRVERTDEISFDSLVEVLLMPIAHSWTETRGDTGFTRVARAKGFRVALVASAESIDLLTTSRAGAAERLAREVAGTAQIPLVDERTDPPARVDEHMSDEARRRYRPQTGLAPEHQFRNLAVAACADGKLTRGEADLLQSHAVRLQLTPDQGRKILFSARNGALAGYRAPATADGRRQAFREIAEMMRADGRLATAERRALEALARGFELPAEEARAMVEDAG